MLKRINPTRNFSLFMLNRSESFSVKLIIHANISGLTEESNIMTRSNALGGGVGAGVVVVVVVALSESDNVIIQRDVRVVSLYHMI